MTNFWDYSVWGWMLLFGVVLASLLVGNVIKNTVPFLRSSLIPTSVIGGAILLMFAGVYKLITGEVMFDTAVFDGRGTEYLEIITYHALALGFIASAFKTTGTKLTRSRTTEIFNTGATTVSTYLLQAIVGLVVTFIAALVVSGFFPAAGVLLPFGYGQGTGQALNYGIIYETEYGFSGGSSFGLAIAALGFVSAAVGGVIHLNLRRRRGKLEISSRCDGSLHSDPIESYGEIPMQESVDKITIQMALIVVAYGMAYAIMFAFGQLFPGVKSLIFGFNFLIGVLTATLMKLTMNLLLKKGVLKKKYTNNFLMTRVSNFFFDVMIVSGVAAIRLDTLENYWGILIIMGVLGAVVTYVYNRVVAKTLFPEYTEEQFLAMYGMLTGTASTGVILLREIDRDFRTPVSDNVVYQNFPAIVMGFPMMLLANLAPKKPIVTFIIFIVFFLVMNIILFRSKIFKRRSNKADREPPDDA